MAHFVTCVYCGTRFDRDKEEYAAISARRYAHAACMLREAEKDPNYVKKEIIVKWLDENKFEISASGGVV